LARFNSLSFDCYGTLIDWESGLMRSFGALFGLPVERLDKRELLERFARIEAEIEAAPYVKYREVLTRTAERIRSELGLAVDAEAAARFGASVGEWDAFPDTVEALARLKRRYKLIILSNVDDDLFAATAPKLKVPFDRVITAQQVGSYKPSQRNFEALLKAVPSKERHLHVAQSLFHDHVPAQAIGLHSVWINRYGQDQGAVLQAKAKFDLEFPDLRSFADACEL
jgi:2-haloalkanoic acid dehalogenase type II